jgi:hypothetical protein
LNSLIKKKTGADDDGNASTTVAVMGDASDASVIASPPKLK